MNLSGSSYEVRDEATPENGEGFVAARAPLFPKAQTVEILGIPFLTNPTDEAVELSLRGGLIVVPSAPLLAADLMENHLYREALVHADFVLPDSGAMVLAWNVAHLASPAKRLSRLSGLEFLRVLIPRLSARSDLRTFWIMPNEVEQKANLSWLRSQGIKVSEGDSYVAPNYTAQDQLSGSRLRDPELLARIEAARPDVIVVNVAGGVQEPLGFFLPQELSYRPSIICTGAAIAFLTGCQAAIPDWADRYYLGWLLRILHTPQKFVPRYVGAAKIFWLLARHRDEMPRAQGRVRLT